MLVSELNATGKATGDKMSTKPSAKIRTKVRFSVNNIHLMYGPEGNSFVFPRVRCFPRRSRGKHHNSRKH